MNTIQEMEHIARYLRYLILTSTTKAGSGHPTSCLSAVELVTALFFGGSYCYDLDNPQYDNNDRFILSKGHAAPLLYALYVACGVLSEEQLFQLRTYNSLLEGHPSIRFPYTEVATGSLGQGLSIGVGMALAGYHQGLDYTTYVLLGDGEMAEGQNWEAIQIASYYKLGNLVGIIDVSGLAQVGETMYGEDSLHGASALSTRIASFGWDCIIVKGHNLQDLVNTYRKIKLRKNKTKPVMIIAHTIKGKGISFLEGKDGWHGKSLSYQELSKALQLLGDIDDIQVTQLLKPKKVQKKLKKHSVHHIAYPHYIKSDEVEIRKGYGDGLVQVYSYNNTMVVLDANVSNSTYANIFKNKYAKCFYEMYIAEQNMVSVALGMTLRGCKPYISTFSSFLTRAFDQIRMAQYSNPNLIICGSHAGVSIGEDGPSQMGLEDIGMLRSIQNSIILYPSDAVSMMKAVLLTKDTSGIVYIRSTRSKAQILYDMSEEFEVGKSKVLRHSKMDRATVIAAGITTHEAIVAYELLKKRGIYIRVIDVFSIKPLDEEEIRVCAHETNFILVVEDHVSSGGIGEAVAPVLLSTRCKFKHLCIKSIPRSGSQKELLKHHTIDSNAIVQIVLKTL